MLPSRLLLVLLGTLLPTVLWSQTGSIAGRITDAANGRPLGSVTVRVVGTYYGAIAKRDGNYQIKNVAPGTYTLEVSLIGYVKIQRTGVRVAPNQELTLDFKLTETSLTLGKEITVIGERPLIDVEQTQSVRRIGREQVEASVVKDITDVVTQQPGVVVANDEIHIRGGRSYEAGYLIDGVTAQDPLAGTGFGLQLSAAAIEEVEIITGGFNAEYGQATSGIVKVRTKEGGRTYSGSGSFRRGYLLHTRSPQNGDVGQTFATDVAEFSLGGPIPGTAALTQNASPITFFLNAYGAWTDGIAPEAARPTDLRSSLFPSPLFTLRPNNTLNGLVKFAWNASPEIKLTYSFNGSGSVSQNSRTLQTNLEYVDPEPGYQYRFQNNPNGAISYNNLNLIHTFGFQHTVSAATLYEVTLSRYFARLLADGNGLDYPDYTEPQDIPGVPAEYYETGDTNRLGMIPGDGFYDTGNGEIWHDHFIDDWGIKAELTHVPSETNTLKAGAELHLQEMQLADIYKPWLGPLGLNNDIYHVNPAVGAMYVQDAVQFKGLVLNVGLRYDFWFPGALADDAIEQQLLPTITSQTAADYLDHTVGLFGRRMKSRISPRLGVSHPITNAQMLFFSYGHFTKWPRPQLVYAKLDPQQASSSYQTYGNPDLEPETTISYELGIKNQLTEDDALTVKVFYNDKFDYIQRRSVAYSDPRYAGRSFTTYANGDYARNRGLELEYEKRIGRWFTGGANLTYSLTTGKSRSENPFNAALGGSEETLREDYMPWDKPLQGRAFAIFNAAPADAPFGIAWLGNSQLSADLNIGSGKRYTPALFTGDTLANGRPVYSSDGITYYSAIAQLKWWINLKARKFFQIGTARLTVSVEVENLLDVLNSEIINPATGRAWEHGDPTPLGWNDPIYPDLQAPLDPYPNNPARYSNRRNVRVGMEVKF
ncbi:MAG: TonB-dependent receptor [Candidatus Kapabacteria bacterium]|nr:TonB-dependent receptor [Candidatus Kapabacteria bacterium]